MVKSTKKLKDSIRFVKTQTVLMSKVVFDENNPNVMSDEKHEAFDKVIKKYGFAKDPWLNLQKDGRYMVIDGEQGIRRMQAHHIKKFQAKIFRVSYVEVQMLRQIANKLHGEHDRVKDAEEFKAIFEEGKLEFFSEFSAIPIEDIKFELEKEFDIKFEKQEDEDIPEKPKKPKSKLGDVYQLGKHKVMCGDSTKLIKKLLNNKKIDLLLTDPPYGISAVNVKGKTGGGGKLGFTGGGGIVKARQWKKIIGDDKEFDPSLLLTLGHLKIIFGANNFANRLPNNSRWLVWDKKTQDKSGSHTDTFSDVELMWTNIDNKSSKIYRFLWSGLIREGDRKTELKERVHPTQKPVGLFSDIIRDYTKKAQVILDPYLGSGTTLIACEQTDRVCYGMEIDPGYFDVIIERWENFTGKKAKKL